MRTLLKYNIILLCIAALLQSCNTNETEEHHFDNKLFIKFDNPVEDLVFKSGEDPSSAECDLTIGTALEATTTINGKITKCPELKDKYNRLYNTNAELLPDEMCVIEKPEFEILQGGTESLPINIKFTGLEVLDRTKLYVMPVKLTEVNNIDLLSSKAETYFVFKGASLINVVADIAKNNFPVKWINENQVKGLRTITVEALIRVRDFGTVNGEKGEAMSTIFGVENVFLLRLGDSGFPQNQIQLVSPTGKFPENNSELGLPTNEWIHVAVVWSSETCEQILYINGNEVARDNSVNSSQSFDLHDNCFIGKSWNDERWLEGEISELRVWSIQRKQEDIAQNIYELDPTSEGLIAYWKFNEGTGKTVHDWSGNGNDVTAEKDLVWNKVALPE